MSDERLRANYALLDFQEHLGASPAGLDVPWAEFVGDRSSKRTFAVPTDRPRQSYFSLQAFDVGEYGHEVLINGESVSGFDIPPADGWQYWMDTITGTELHGGENTVQIRRHRAEEDEFVVGTLAVHWKEPEE